MERFKPKSILDVGCGIGTWLKVFEDYGVRDFLGIDGDFVDRTMLKISESNFYPQDLTKHWYLGRKFDLVICLEVAEHLPKQAADSFVKALVEHGDIIVFSAAVPGQGGQNHINEQWPSYWQDKFSKYGYYFHDDIRPLIWANEKVECWYRQNMFIVSREVSTSKILPVIHPDLFKEYLITLESIKNRKYGVRYHFGKIKELLKEKLSI
jgi:SAM-dependent methyltransferase